MCMDRLGTMYNNMDNTSTVPKWTAYRYILAYIGFFGCTSIYLMRINFSVAIVCMTYDPVDNSSAAENVSSASVVVRGDSFDSIYHWMPNAQEEVDCSNNLNETEKVTGEFDWDRQLRGTLSSSFFWGYILTQFPGGWLAQKYGGKQIVISGVALSIVTSFLSPPAARLSPYALLAMRFINGLGQGVYYPAFYCLLGKWFPWGERAVLLTIFSSGGPFGSILSFAVSGFLCAEIGWQWIFYIYSIAGTIWVIVMAIFVHETPQDHPTITDIERQHITASLSSKNHTKQPPVPWGALLTDTAVWSIALCDMFNGWALYAGLTQLPQYMQDVLQFDITQNGLYSSLPQLVRMVLSFVFAYIGDYLLVKQIFKVNTLRKIMTSIASLLPMCFVIGVGYLDCSTAALAIVFLVLQEGFTSANWAGLNVSRVDIAPKFAAITLGISNTAGNIPGMVAPIVISIITVDGTRAQWQTVFFMSASMYLAVFLIYTIFGKSEEREWAKVPEDEDKSSRKHSIVGDKSAFGDFDQAAKTDTTTIGSQNCLSSNGHINSTYL